MYPVVAVTRLHGMLVGTAGFIFILLVFLVLTVVCVLQVVLVCYLNCEIWICLEGLGKILYQETLHLLVQTQWSGDLISDT